MVLVFEGVITVLMSYISIKGCWCVIPRNVNLKTGNSWWFLAIYYIPKLSLLLVALGLKLIGPHDDLLIVKKAIPDEQALWCDSDRK